MEWLIATAPITKARTKHPCSGPPPGRRSSAKASAGTEAAPTDRIFKRRRKAEWHMASTVAAAIWMRAWSMESIL